MTWHRTIAIRQRPKVFCGTDLSLCKFRQARQPLENFHTVKYWFLFPGIKLKFSRFVTVTVLSQPRSRLVQAKLSIPYSQRHFYHEHWKLEALLVAICLVYRPCYYHYGSSYRTKRNFHLIDYISNIIKNQIPKKHLTRLLQKLFQFFWQN